MGEPRQPMVFSSEWTTENLRHLVETGNIALDYIFTGAIRQHAGDPAIDQTLHVARRTAQSEPRAGQCARLRSRRADRDDREQVGSQRRRDDDGGDNS